MFFVVFCILFLFFVKLGDVEWDEFFFVCLGDEFLKIKGWESCCLICFNIMFFNFVVEFDELFLRFVLLFVLIGW